MEAPLSNPVPERMARVVDAAFAGAPTLGAPWTDEVSVTRSDDVSAASSSEELARRLALVDEAGVLRSGPFAIIAFDAPEMGVASPVRRSRPGFAGRGRTAGGACEFVIPNQRISDLKGVTIRIVP